MSDSFSQLSARTHCHRPCSVATPAAATIATITACVRIKTSIFGGKEQISAVHIAAQCHDSDVAILQALVEKGANVTSVDCYGRTPLHFSCQVRFVSLVTSSAR